MQHLSQAGQACPFSFNTDAATFQIGDVVSYRVPDPFGDFPFVGTLVAVYADHVDISPNDPSAPGIRMRGTRESRPVVSAAQALQAAAAPTPGAQPC